MNERAQRREMMWGSRGTGTTGFAGLSFWLLVLAALVFPGWLWASNAIVTENANPGTPQSVWDISGAGDPTIQGFGDNISVNVGQTINFKISTDATSYHLDIYRMGYYQGNGARLITSIKPSVTLPQNQPGCLSDPTTGLYDCGNWAISASWAVPSTAVSGIYFARVTRDDTGGASHIMFIVRKDASTSDIMFQASDTSWQAYNDFGGQNLYGCNGAYNVGCRAYKVSYNRPFHTRAFQGESATWVFNAEYPMVRWLEANGYDVTYFTDTDTDRNGGLIFQHKVWMSNGHDEYWSAAQRTNIVAARNAGVHLAFFSGNTMFWKTRWENSIDGSNTAYRTLVCYKETTGDVTDPLDPPTWTGTWRDPTKSPPADGGQPENAVKGNIFRMNGGQAAAITVPASDANVRFWRNTAVANLTTGSATLAPGTIGQEFDDDEDNGFRPAGLFDLSSTSISDPNNYLLDYGVTYGAGTAVHSVVMYRYGASGALVFSTGTYQWAWGLDNNHDNSNLGNATDPSMQQATVNLFADMQVQPASLQAPLTPAGASTDTTPPTSIITYPPSGTNLLPGGSITITGTATDAGGGVVAGVEVSVDGGVTWHPAIGRASWSYTTVLLSGSVTIRSRAVDDSGNLESPSAGVTDNVALQTCPCTIWPSSTTPINPNPAGPDNSVELGLHFKADYPGSIVGIRFYKSASSTGTHVGNLWDPSGTLLASKPFTNETASGWQEVDFDTPVPITANRTVVASYHIDNGHYFDDLGYFTPGPYNNPPLHGFFSVVTYGPGPSVFPSETTGQQNNNNYWVDVVYTSPSMVTLTSITVTPSQATLQIGNTLQFAATGHYSDGSQQNITNQVTWSSSNPVAASINSSGLATALSGDGPVITASMGGVSGTALLSIAGGTLNITTTSVPDGTRNMPYSFQLTATGGVQPYTWTLVSGALPAGLNLSASGQITGTPTTLQTASFTVKVNDSGTKDSINQPQTASETLSLTIDAAPSFFTIWPDTAVPATIDSGDPNAYELGVKFKADLNGTISGIRFYKSSNNTGTHIGNLWTTSGTLLGSATFSSESSSGWQQVNFSSQVPILGGTAYVASYYTSAGHYSVNSNQFANAGVDNPPLHALQNGVSGGDGVFTASATSVFPTSTFNADNYWVDVVFNPATWTTPPTVVSVTPTNGSSGLDTHGTVSAVFSTWMDPTTINSNTFYLLDSSNNVVPATVTYNTATLTATLTPASALTYSATYTAVLVGGSTDPRVKDLAENPLASNYQWSFTATAPPPPPPTSGPGGPILVVSSSSNPFSLYYAEILRAEGLNEFAVQDISTVSGVAALAPYDVVILGDMTLTPAQVTTFTQWVSNGGKLIAMHPDTQLASLLGLVDTSSALSNAYLLLNTSSGPGVGLVGQTIQFHGPAELYTLNTATSYANLFSNASAPAGSPAVTVNSFGLGQAAAFTYDLAKSVIYTRQGNPAWSGEARDGLAPTRSDNLFFGNATFDPEPDWVDFNKIQIPQADEQQRLLANLILQMETKPLPRFWYLPRGLQAVVIMTGDDHGTAVSGGATGPRFDQYIAASAPACRVDNWECVRATGYLFPPLLAANPLTNAQAAAYIAQGFEVAVHTDTNPDCSNFTMSSLQSAYAAQLSSFASAYPSIPASQTNRTHCVVWSDYDSEPQVLLGDGIRLDTTYYYYPSTWVNDRPGLFTGSGMPMRFTKSDGTMLDIYQAATQLTDESGQTYPFEVQTLLENALNLGYYGAFTANMHADVANSPEATSIVATAQSLNVPVVSSLQMLHWLDGRNGSSFAIQSWDGATLTFNILVGDNAYGLETMLPASVNGVALSTLTLNGSPVTFTTQLIKGVQYAVFTANADGTYSGHYGASGVASISLNPTAVIGGDPSIGTVTLNSTALIDTVVTLQSSASAATVPPSVTVPHGSTSATFPVSTSPVSTATQAVISGSFMNGSAQATITVNPGSLIPESGWSVVSVDSQETICGNGVGSNAIDNNPNTMWHTQFCPSSAALPHTITINLGAAYDLTAFQYLPRQDGSACGWIKDYAFYVSADGVNWGSPVITGTFDYGTLSTNCPGPGAGVPAALQIAFAQTTGRYIRLVALSELHGNPWTSVAELHALGKFSASNPAIALTQVTVSPTIVVGGTGAQGTVILSEPAPAGGIVVTLGSSNAAATVPASVTVPANSTTASFPITTTTVGTVTQLNISGTYNSASVQTAFTVNPGSLIPQAGWSVVSVDSQETICGNGVGSNAIDGNPSTMWHTQFCPNSAPLPHTITINLGASYSLTAFQYLPRQDGSACGWIKDYAFYVSPDGSNWGSPVTTGTFNYGNLSTNCPGPGASVPVALQIAFPETTGQYIRLVALSELHGNPWTSVAELTVLGVVSANTPPPSLTQVTANPTIVVGGASAQGTVSLSEPAPTGGAVVSLASSDSSTTVPTSVTVPANSATATFPITTTTVGAVTPVTITGTYNSGSVQAAFTVNPGSLVSQAGWSLWYADSQEKTCLSASGADGSATHAFDGDPTTMWLTQVCDPSSGAVNIAPLPHEIQINLGASYDLTAFTYLAPQDGNTCGWIKQYEFYVSTDGSTWGSPVASGVVNYGAVGASCTGVPTAQQIAFPQTMGQYIRLRALSEQFGNQWIGVAELNVLSTSSASSPSVAQVTVNPSIVVGGTSAQGTVILSGPAPTGGAVVTLGSSNPAATVPASVTLPAGALSVNFPITTSASVGSATQLNITASYNNGGVQAGFTVNPGSLISQAGWSVLAVDSQETTCTGAGGFDGEAIHAFDGNNVSMWLTQVCPTVLPLPHHIDINLGASYDLTAFSYLAPQDGNTCGWIKGYQLFVSADGVNWPAQPNAQGTFNYGALGTNCAAVPPALQIAFPQATGQYVRLVALSEQFGDQWIGVAELNMLAAPVAGLTAGATTITAGSSTTLTPTFSGGTGSIDQGVGAVVSGTPVLVTPSGTTTYTLTVTNAAGSTATATATVTVD